MRSSPRNPVFYTYRMPFGTITIAADEESVTKVALGSVIYEGKLEPNELTNACATELAEYLSGKRSIFDVPVKLDGTDFQMKVWRAIEEIPYGQTRTAKEVAESIGQPNAYRKVGSAVKANPLVILIPAHRVIPSNGYVDSSDPHAKLRAAFRELEVKYG